MWVCHLNPIQSHGSWQFLLPLDYFEWRHTPGNSHNKKANGRPGPSKVQLCCAIRYRVVAEQRRVSVADEARWSQLVRRPHWQSQGNLPSDIRRCSVGELTVTFFEVSNAWLVSIGTGHWQRWLREQRRKQHQHHNHQTCLAIAIALAINTK